MSGHVMLLNIAGGVALLLWATRMIRTGILRAFGASLRHILGRSTDNRFYACGAGLGVTLLVQSSAATALLAMSFASRELISTASGLAIMLGANVGSTAVVQVLSFDLSWLSPALILVGVVVFLASSAPLWQHLSRVTVGLGLMILALSLIVDASTTLRGSDVLATLIAPLSQDHVLALLLAIALTWLCHSSVALVLLTMSFVTTGVVPLELGVVMVVGANLGSGIVPLVLGLSENPRARRIPLGNLLFRLASAGIVLPFIGLITPYLAVTGGNLAHQIANFHTLFNLALAAGALPLVGVVARLTKHVFPVNAEIDDPEQPKYLDAAAVDKPVEATACAVRESLRMADAVDIMLREVIDVFPTNDTELLARLSKLDDKVDALHDAIKRYIAQVNPHCQREQDRIRCDQIIDFTTNLEHVGDIVDKNLLEIAQQKIDEKVTFSDAGWAELTRIHSRLTRQMQLAMSVFISGEKDLARKLLAGKRRVREMALQGNALHFSRLQNNQIESLETSGLHLDILRDFRQIDSHLASIAYTVLEARDWTGQPQLEVVGHGSVASEPATPGKDADGVTE